MNEPRTAVAPDGPNSQHVSSRPARRWLLLLPLLLFLVGALVLLVLPFFREPVPTPEQWRAAARQVRERWQPGDVVRLEPTWLTAGRVYFGDVDSGARRALRILDVHEPVDPLWLYRFQRLWLVRAVESRGRALAVAPPGAELVEEVELEGLTLSLYTLPRDVIRWEMREALAGAELTRQGPKGETTCRWQAGRLRCKLKGDLDVEEALRQVAGGPRQCVVVRPGPGTAPATLRFPGIVGPGRLVVRMGNTIEAARGLDGGDVTVSVSLGEEALGELVLKRRDYDLHEVAGGLSDGSEKDLVIRLQATDDKKREVCLEGYLVDLAPGAQADGDE